MTVIYLDELFLLNLVVGYLLLSVAERLSGEMFHRGWLALGVTIGAIYATAAVLLGTGLLLRLPCKLRVAVLVLLTGYGKSRRSPWVSPVFFAVFAAFGGGTLALQFLGGWGLTLQNGIFYPAMDLRLILLLTAGCYVLITLLLQCTAQYNGLCQELVPVVLVLEGRWMTLIVLVDTSNAFTDPVTEYPVVVVEGEKVGVLLPDGQAPAPEELRRPVETLERLGRQSWQGRYRLLPYQAMGVERGMLPILRLGRMRVRTEDYGKLLPVLFPTCPTNGGDYHALIGA